MGFLSELTLVQRAGGAGVLVLLLVLLLVKQRQAKAAPAGAKEDGKKRAASKAPKRTKATVKADSKDTKRRSFGGSKRSRKKDDGSDTPVAEPAKAGRMVPRLPAAHAAPDGGVAPVDFPEMAGPMDAAPMAEAVVDGAISEPGWPTPGEVWAAPDATPPADASWHEEDASDDALTALAEAPAADATEWAADDQSDFDAALGWETPVVAEEAAPASAEASEATWQAEEETFDWTAGDAVEGWATSEPEPAELTAAETTWETSEEETATWSNSDTTEWAAAESVEETPAVATAVAEEFSVNDWAAPAEEPVAEDDVAPQIVWEPVDETEEAVAEVEVEVEQAPIFEDASVFEESTSVDAADPETSVTEDAPIAVEAEVVAPVAVEAEVVAPVEDAPPVAPTFVTETTPDVAIQVMPEMPSVVVEAEEVREFAYASATAAEVAMVSEAPVGVAVDPAQRWASLTPGGGPDARPTTTPVESWARLQPGYIANGANGHGTNGHGMNGHRTNGSVGTRTAVNGANGHHAPAAANGTVATMPATPAEVTAPALAWWDVPTGAESDPSRGRFALGGYALQPGHQVVSGVTFRDGVVPPPIHWVIGPVVGAVAPGTLVLNVDGCLNCRPEDLAVLTDPGFAPTTDGFSLRLAAAATGPFAASGTYVIS